MAFGAAPGDADERPDARRFVLTGLIATAVDIGIAVGLLGLGFDRLTADLVALGAAAVISRLLHARYTLRGDQLDRWIRQPPVFGAVAVIAGAVDLVIFVSLGSIAALAAKCIAVGVSALIRAFFHRVVLFRVVRREQGIAVHRPPAAGRVRLSVVVPAFNEEGRIADTIHRIGAELAELDGGVEIVIVDDGSSDATADAARAAGADQVVVQPRNRGKGAAVRAGVAVATGRTIAFTDADLAYAPFQIVAFVEAIESGYDVAIGNRHHHDTDTLTGTSALRSFGSRIVNMATHLLLLGNYRDTQCGCKAFRSDAGKLVMGAGAVDGFAFDIEVLHLVERYGLSMVEMPVEVVNSDTSTVSAVRDGLRVLRDIVRIRQLARRGHYPSSQANALPNPVEPPIMDPSGRTDDHPQPTSEAEPEL